MDKLIKTIDTLNKELGTLSYCDIGALIIQVLIGNRSIDPSIDQLIYIW